MPQTSVYEICESLEYANNAAGRFCRIKAYLLLSVVLSVLK